MLAVSDTGQGMDRQTLSQVFEPFFTTKEMGRGTGLGLSTVYGIVKQSEGYIWAYSEPGRGSTFKVYLPEVAQEAASPPKPTVEPGQVGRGEVVLLVEDDDAVRRMAKRALEDAGYGVVEPTYGHAALELLSGDLARVSLVLTDVVMPGMGGRVLAERAAQVRPGLPVLFTSGYTDGEIVRRGSSILAPPSCRSRSHPRPSRGRCASGSRRLA